MSSWQPVAQWSASERQNLISALRHQDATAHSLLWPHAGPLKAVIFCMLSQMQHTAIMMITFKPLR